MAYTVKPRYTGSKNNGNPPISNAERRSLPFLLTFFVNKTPLSPDPTITENPRITEGLASPQAYYLPSRVAETGAHLAHCASELQHKSRTYRFDNGKKLGKRRKKQAENGKIRRINRVLILITFTFVVGTLSFHELKRKMQKTSSFMQYFHNNS